ncbi:MAG: hypothetical protein DMG13_27070 [Acidobacteria bacterium]|nr:MAG: hypothetical protein DMG13_27070 [Acidobacteriota bacterium]
MKRSGRFREQDLAALQEFVTDYPVAKAYLLYGGSHRLKFGSIEVVPLQEAIKYWLPLIS